MLELGFDKNQLATVAQDYGLRLVLLYGSRAEGRARPDSDLDIAMMGCPNERFWSCYDAMGKVFFRVSLNLDLVRLESADALFRYEIMRVAVLLYGDPDLFFDYRAYAYRDFVDSSDLFALEAALSRKKMSRIEKQLHDSP